VIRVQREVDWILLRDHIRILGESDGAGHHVLDPRPRRELGTTSGHLNDAVAAGVGKSTQRGIQGLG